MNYSLRRRRWACAPSTTLRRFRLSPPAAPGERLLRFEQLEARRLLSVGAEPASKHVDAALAATPLFANPVQVAQGAVEPSWVNAVDDVANLANYTAAELASTRQWVVAAAPASDRAPLAARLGGVWEASSHIDGVHLWTPPPESDPAAALAASGGLLFYYPLVPREQTLRFIPNDTLFGNQWHLRNTGQTGGTVGADVNIVGAWDNYSGAGVTIGIVDDGLQRTHPDLAAHYVAADSWDFNFNDADPSPSSSNPHGTSVAGVAAAVGSNSLGVTGSGRGASLAGLRLIAAGITDAQMATAETYHNNSVDIYSNSWGPNEDGATLEGPGPLTLAALDTATTSGRGGLGNIYLWAAGNGLQVGDDVNYDGYANNRHVIAVSAIDHNAVQSNYSEPGAAILVAAPSSGTSVGITTTDLVGASGYANGDYNSVFGGTSSSTPLVAGIISLMLEANPNLTWRDVKHILVDTAKKNHGGDADWTNNAAGHHVNHKYGFGAVDATAAVTAAQTWIGVGPESSTTSGTVTVNAPIPDNNATGVSSTVTINANLKIETVEVVFTATHPFRGDLNVVLTSPSGTQSRLAEPHGDPNANYSSWVFTTVRDWDELSAGQWTLTVSDRGALDVGTFNSWRLNVYGTETAPPEIEVRGNGLAIVDGDITPTLADFTEYGNVPVSGGQKTRTFSVNNVGGGTLSLPGSPRVNMTGAHAGDFTVTTQPAASVTGGAATTFDVRFDPSGPGLRIATVNIVNNDVNENPYNFFIEGFGADAVVSPTAGLSTSEAGGAAQFTIALTSQPTADVTINLSSSDATEGTVSPASLTFSGANWDQTQTVTVTGQDDVVYDGDVSYSAITAAAASADAGYNGLVVADVSLTNLDDDPPPSLAVEDISLAEGNAGFTAAVFNVRLSVASGLVATVAYATVDGTALAGEDYTAATGTLTFLPGTTLQTVSVPVAGDVSVEPDETFTLELSAPVNATIADGQGLGTIANDDVPVVVSVDDASLVEPDSGITIVVVGVHLSGPSGQTVKVAYATANDTATAGSDYSARSGTLTFSPGTTALSVGVPVLGDVRDESDETFLMNLSSPTAATIGDGQAVVTIVDNDPLPEASIDDVSAVETDAGGNAHFTVSLSAPSGRTITIAYAALAGSATAPADFAATAGTLTFSPGSTVRTIDVPIAGDQIDENDETFSIELFNPTNVALADASGTGTILDDDPPPALAVAAAAVAEGDGGTALASFLVTLSAVSEKTVTVGFQTADGEATAPDDYLAASGTLTFAPGTTAQTIVVAVVGDSLVEADETFAVSLADPLEATLSVDRATGTILNDDVVLSLVVTNTLDSGPGSLRQAVLNANATLGVPDTIVFQIPGAGPHAIELAAPLPALIDPATAQIDSGEVQVGTFSVDPFAQFASLSKTGAGTLVLGGNQAYAVGAQLTVDEGTVRLASDAGENLSIGVATQLIVAAPQHLAGLSIGAVSQVHVAAGGTTLLVAQSLAIAAGGQLDLADNDLVVPATAVTRAAVLAEVTQWLASGLHAFGWDGPGIASSAAAADADHLTALGVMLNDDGLGGAYRPTFDGQPVDANSILVKYTYFGDADLSGTVDGTDYALVDNGFNTGLADWFAGDFDYSHAVNGTDYALIDNAFNSQIGPLAAGVPGAAGPASPLLRADGGTRGAAGIDAAAATIADGLVEEGLIELVAGAPPGRRRR